MQSDSRTRFIPIGLMLFALFFGAGNLIFPASMGQAAGTDVWWALLGFCITGVGLPLLTVMAVGYSGLPGVREIGNRVHPWFGVFYSTVCILAIGPCFAVPRTGTVSWEIAIVPFLEPSQLEVGMPIFLAVFLGVAGWLAASPSKLVDRVGKILTPLLVLTLVVFIIKSFITPMGEPQTPAAPYATPVMAVVQGILDGYNTLDAIAALIFASLTIGVVRDAGFTKQSDIAREVFKAALIAAPMLGVIYIFIAKIGAESVSAIGIQETGAPILALSAKLLFGNGGAMLLAAMVILACLTTAIGLISCTAAHFMNLSGGRIKYGVWVVIFTVISYLIGLFGLKTIIVSTIPVLMFLYPLCVALVILSFLHNMIGGRRCVWVWTIGLTFVMALYNGLQTAKIAMGGLEAILAQWVPLHTYGLGWIPFAVVGFVIGMIHKSLTKGPAQP